MIWLMIAYAVVLFYFAANPQRIVHRRRFRVAWMLFALVPIVSGLFTFLRAFTIGFAKSMAILEIISSSLSWTLIGVSLLIVLGALLPPDKESDGVGR
jgi:hypothetical protein